MTLGVLTAVAGGAALTIMTGGAAGPVVVGALVGTAAETAAMAGAASGAIAASTGAAATAAAGGAAAAAAGAEVAGVVSGTALAGMTAKTAVDAGLVGASVFGPAGALLACFKEDTKVVRNDREIVAVGDLNLNDKILSQNNIEDLSSHPVFATVTNATIIHGSFTAHEFIFESGNMLTVTSPHYMLIYKDGSFQMVAAKDVQVSDIMCLENGKFSRILEIKDTILRSKVNIETNTGLLYANGVMTSGMCEYGPSGQNDASQILNEYKASHFEPGVALISA